MSPQSVGDFIFGSFKKAKAAIIVSETEKKRNLKLHFEAFLTQIEIFYSWLHRSQRKRDLIMFVLGSCFEKIFQVLFSGSY